MDCIQNTTTAIPPTTVVPSTVTPTTVAIPSTTVTPTTVIPTTTIAMTTIAVTSADPCKGMFCDNLMNWHLCYLCIVAYIPLLITSNYFINNL